MKLVMQRYTGQVYTHLDDDGTMRHFDIEKMKALAPSRAVLIDAPIDFNIAGYIGRNNDVDPDYAASLSEERLNEPAIAVMFKGETNHILLVDGSHRLVRLVADGKTTQKCWVFPVGSWEDCLLNLVGSNENIESVRRRAKLREKESAV